MLAITQYCENAPVIGPGCAALSPGSANRTHRVARPGWRAASPIRPDLGFRHAQVEGHQATSACKGMTRARQPQRKAPLAVGAERHSRARVSQMTVQELGTLAQRHIHSLTAIIDHLNKIGAQDELRRISLHLRRLASLIDDARRILL